MLGAGRPNTDEVYKGYGYLLSHRISEVQRPLAIQAVSDALSTSRSLAGSSMKMALIGWPEQVRGRSTDMPGSHAGAIATVIEDSFK